MIGYKKALLDDETEVIVELDILGILEKDTIGYRTNKAKVLSIKSLDGKKSYSICRSIFIYEFIYEVNKDIIIDDNDYNNYGEGIYFFLDKKEAIDYYRQKYKTLRY